MKQVCYTKLLIYKYGWNDRLLGVIYTSYIHTFNAIKWYTNNVIHRDCNWIATAVHHTRRNFNFGVTKWMKIKYHVWVASVRLFCAEVTAGEMNSITRNEWDKTAKYQNYQFLWNTRQLSSCDTQVALRKKWNTRSNICISVKFRNILLVSMEFLSKYILIIW